MEDVASIQTQWNAVAFTIRFEEPRAAEIQNEVEFFRKCGLLQTELLVVVEDPCVNIGSGGSTLNALLVVAERLCSLRGFDVLNQDVLEDARILIIHLGESFSNGQTELFNAAFCNMGKLVLFNGFCIPATPLSQLLLNAQKMAFQQPARTWIFGSCAFWRTQDDIILDNSQDIIAFTFEGTPDMVQTHGVYEVASDGLVQNIRFREQNLSNAAKSLVCLTAFSISPAVTIAILSLHSAHPISACTYYGQDKGAVGYKISLFFDLVLAGCTTLEEFLNSPVIAEKCFNENSLRGQIWMKTARKKIHAVLGQYKAYTYVLTMDAYCYFGDSAHSFSILQSFCKNTTVFGADIIRMIFDELGTRLLKQPTVQHASFMPLLRSLANLQNNMIPKILRLFQHICESADLSQKSRVLSLISTFLCLLAAGNGGVRGGPAANPKFASSFALLRKEQSDSWIQGLQLLFDEAIINWLHDPARQIRAARHFEAAAQFFTQHTICHLCAPWRPSITNSLDKKNKFKKVTTLAAVRMDIYGGWLDTPPIAFDIGNSAVINAAIRVDDQKPLRICIEVSTTPAIIIKLNDDESAAFHTASDMAKCASDPTAPGALICACLIASGLFEHSKEANALSDTLAEYYDHATPGLIIECNSILPQGSGLGTSSILAGAFLATLWTLFDIKFNEQTIHFMVLYVEQLLTTGGGWQDSVGGLSPGVKVSRFNFQRKIIETKQFALSDELRSTLNNDLVLLYAGKTRLAKNLLQQVVRSWQAQDGAAVDAVRTMEREVESVAANFVHGKLLPQSVDEYMRCKCVLAAGCIPDAVSQFVSDASALRENHCSAPKIRAFWPAGAGGGGFQYILLESNSAFQDLDHFLHQNQQKFPGFSLHRCSIDDEPLIITPE